MGRPRKAPAEKLVPVSTSLPPWRYDELYRLAQAGEMRVSELIRILLMPVSSLQKHKPNVTP